MITEDKARQNWCPMYRYTPGGHANQDNRNPEGSRCIGSECMAWRWSEPMFDGPDSYVADPGPTGFCGLAGKPDE